MEDVRGKPEQRKRGPYRPQSATLCPVLLALSGRPRGWRKHLCTQNYGDRTGRSPENPLSPQCPGFLTKEGGAGCVRSSFPLGTPRTGPAEDGGEAEGPAAPPGTTGTAVRPRNIPAGPWNVPAGPWPLMLESGWRWLSEGDPSCPSCLFFLSELRTRSTQTCTAFGRGWKGDSSIGSKGQPWRALSTPPCPVATAPCDSRLSLQPSQASTRTAVTCLPDGKREAGRLSDLSGPQDGSLEFRETPGPTRRAGPRCPR